MRRDGAILHALAREFDDVFELTQRLYGVIREHALPTAQSDFGWLRGRALVARGQVDEGLRLMREAARSAEETGMRFGLCGYYTHHVSACLALGLVEEARASDLGMVLPGLRASASRTQPSSSSRANGLLAAGENP